ncbi:Unannotated [Lentimonas sp. CC19]|nr:Unannotated [Lentimonas sp. CC19]CAA6694005.1 Unannotated [Lentimonas sp. CC10]CAA7072232.1 Unannotated [Lentimonas sp. CC11]
MTSDALDLLAATDLKIEFWFDSNSMATRECLGFDTISGLMEMHVVL